MTIIQYKVVLGDARMQHNTLQNRYNGVKHRRPLSNALHDARKEMTYAPFFCIKCLSFLSFLAL